MPKPHRVAKRDWLDYPGMENKCPVKLGKKVVSCENYYPITRGEIRVLYPIWTRTLCHGHDHFPAHIKGANSQREIAVPAIRGLESALQLGDVRFDIFAPKSE
jgi:hypothetical protein